jgi:ATP-dependent protease ClpP protease subunit
MINKTPKSDHQQIVPKDMILDEMKHKNATKHRRIDLSDEVDRDEIYKALYYLNKRVEQDKVNGTKEDITLVFDSYGGVIYNGLSLISRMEQLIEQGYNIITEVTGVAMSMGSALSVSGNVRKAYRHCTIMFHQPSSATWGKLQDQIEDIAETQRLWDLMKKIIMKNTLITDEMLEDIKSHKRDWYMDAETALKLGVIHEIL